MLLVNLIFNAESLRPPITGVGNYSFHLLEQLIEGSIVEDVHCFSGTHWLSGDAQLESTRALKAQSGDGDKGTREKTVHAIRQAIGRIPGTQSLYSYLMERRFGQLAYDIPNAVYHETNYILKPYPGPCVTTVHDLSHVRYPEFHSQNVIDWLGKLLPETLDRADRIITVSDVIRDELVEFFGVPQDKIQTVYEGVDPRYQPRSNQETMPVIAEYGLSHKQYVLLVATLEPRKGIDVLLDAWSLLPLGLRKAFPLVLVGSSGWRNSALIDRISSLINEGTVRRLGYVPADVLPLLFSGASVFAYPSVYEGFGLPVLDAMNSGVPVICRAGTSMAEFSEGACLLCESSAPEELAAKLELLLGNEEERERWARIGLAQAEKFSWKRCADETAEVYRQVV
jgi:glycosyltransferase involved in cell wall biosynthesis